MTNEELDQEYRIILSHATLWVVGIPRQTFDLMVSECVKFHERGVGECVWKEVVDTPHRRLIDNCDRYYKTSCGKAWASFEGRTPEQYAYKFCMGCGKLIRVERGQTKGERHD